MHMEERIDRPAIEPPAPRKTYSVLKLGLNGCIAIAIIAIVYFGYVYIARSASSPKNQQPATAQAPYVIQLDVLNGCGARGAAAKITKFLRGAGFDVVEMKNYKVATMQKTLVVDRIGDLAPARRVAAALGVADKNIVQQINPDYFVEVSVIIGADYASLESLRH
jgi:hypothetical protein